MYRRNKTWREKSNRNGGRFLTLMGNTGIGIKDFYYVFKNNKLSIQVTGKYIQAVGKQNQRLILCQLAMNFHIQVIHFHPFELAITFYLFLYRWSVVTASYYWKL